MNPVRENSFLRPFLTVVASLVLVCGGLMLLTSTAPWTPRQEVADGAPAAPQPKIAFAPSKSDEQTPPADPVAEASGGGAEIEVAEAELPASEPVQYAASESPTTQSEEAVAPSVSSQGAVPAAVESEASANESMMVAEPGTGAEAVKVGAPETDLGPQSVAADGGAPATHVAVDTKAAADQKSEPATPVAVETTEAAGPNSVEPATPVAVETTEAADKSGELLAESPAPSPITTETIGEDTGDGAKPATPAPTRSLENIGGAGATTKPNIPALPLAPPPPLPKRKPSVEPSVSAEAARPTPQAEPPSRPDAPKQVKSAPTAARQALKQAQAAPPVAQQASQAQAGGGARQWHPMGLAPADKPTMAQPKARLSGAAYSSKVWGALARHKPRAGQTGSATVVFSIGKSGALGGVRIGRSSGNTKIDQLALATVRGAAPFPPPPSGPASFSIRIDF